MTQRILWAIGILIPTLLIGFVVGLMLDLNKGERQTAIKIPTIRSRSKHPESSKSTPTQNRNEKSVAAEHFESRWEGILKWGDNKTESKLGMWLKRDGQNLSGTVSYKERFGVRGPYELEGKIESSGSFILTEATGVIWKGRFSSGDQISGVRGIDDPDTPMRPFTLARRETFPPGTMLEPKEAGPTSGDWTIFFDQFQVAVHNRDREAVRTMMARNFGFRNDFTVAPEKVFSVLDWGLLEKTIAGGTSPHTPSVFKRPTRVARNLAPCGAGKPCHYQVWVGFELGMDNQWRWSYMTFPGD